MPDILAEARAVRDATNGPVDPDLEPSAMWAGLLQQMHVPLIRDATSAEGVVTRLTGENFFSLPMQTGDPVFFEACRRLNAVFNPRDLPEEVEETELAHGEVRFAGPFDRRLSIAFHWHLAAASRFTGGIPHDGRVLEIGGGYGGLARIVKLARPDVQYVLVDMRDSLVCAYVFLRTTMPDAHVKWAMTRGDVLDTSADFILVPTCALSALTGIRADVVVNMQSFSEMRAPTVRYFLNWIQNDIDARRLYSCNRYLKDPGCGDDVPALDLKLGSGWTERMRIPDTLGNCYPYPDLQPMLELLLENTAA
jgi:hypothetical protein